jgi:hypothetical protein
LCFFVRRVTSIVPALAPAKALRSGAPMTTRRRSSRAARAAASGAATDEPPRNTTVATGPQQEETAAAAAAAAATALVLKDRLGDQRGGGEWEPIKILLKNLAYAPKSLLKNLPHTCQDHVVTTDLLTLGTS